MLIIPAFITTALLLLLLFILHNHYKCEPRKSAGVDNNKIIYMAKQRLRGAFAGIILFMVILSFLWLLI